MADFCSAPVAGFYAAVDMLDAGRIAHEVCVDVPHPRTRGDARLTALEAEILTAIFRDGSAT